MFASATIDMLTLFVARSTDRVGDIALDPRVLIFALAVSILTGLIFGTVPALASRMDIVKALKEGGKGASEGGGHRRVQGALIVVQVAVSVMLPVGAGLLLASFYRMEQVVAQVYVPLRQTPFGLAGRVLVRTNGDPLSSANCCGPRSMRSTPTCRWRTRRRSRTCATPISRRRG